MKTSIPFAARAFVTASLLSCLVSFSDSSVAQGFGQTGWASQNDKVAKQLIEKERQWATLSCTPKILAVAYGTAFIKEFIADDFVGTHPEGTLYSKSDMLKLPKDWEPEQDCKLLSAKVRFVEPNVAVIYGSESAIVKGTDGKKSMRTLIWTDTLLSRAGRWQVIAVQDMAMPTK
jgi:hypothetical protein